MTVPLYKLDTVLHIFYFLYQVPELYLTPKVHLTSYEAALSHFLPQSLLGFENRKDNYKWDADTFYELIPF